MTHNPLCVELYTQVIPIPAERCIACSVITKVREDTLAKAIAAVESVHSPIQYGENTYCRGCADAAYDEFSFTWPCPVVNSVRALQGKP
jgi:hypothetical protein